MVNPSIIHRRFAIIHRQSVEGRKLLLVFDHRDFGHESSDFRQAFLGNRQMYRIPMDQKTSESIDNPSITPLNPSVGIVKTQRNRPIIGRQIPESDRQTTMNHLRISVIHPIRTMNLKETLKGSFGYVALNLSIADARVFTDLRARQSSSNRKVVPVNRKPKGTRTGGKQ